jgi:hypothetical protein
MSSSGRQLLMLTFILRKVVTLLGACVGRMMRSSTRARDSHQQVVYVESAANDGDVE